MGIILSPIGLAFTLLVACQNSQTQVGSQSPLIEQVGEELSEEVRVGLLLPLSGPVAGIGKDMLRAAEMALLDAGPNELVLLPRDTGGSADGAARAAEELLNEGIELLIGPLYSEAVKAVTPLAQAADVRVLAFSNVTSVAAKGVFLMGFRPEEQVDRVVQYALDQGIKTIAGLAPNDAYGEIAMSALERAVIENGGIMGEIHLYSPTLDDPLSVMREIAGYRERAAALKREQGILEGKGEEDMAAQAALKQIGSLDTFGNMPFDAILIADGGDRLRSIASLLTFYGVEPADVQFLGTTRWQDDPRVLSDGALAGSWLAASSPASYRLFETRFNQTYDKKPEPLASLAHDAAALAVIVQRDLGDRHFEPINLGEPRGFAGATGLFRLKRDGLAQHGFAVVEVANGDVQEIDPTPIRFEDEFFDAY